MQSLLKTLVLVTLFFVPNLAMAADVTIEMLNKQGKESMVYSQKIVNVNVGDTVFWKATTKGKNVQFMKCWVQDVVEKFKSKMNKDTEYTFTVPGIYAYWCTPHKSMGMIGFVVVGGDKSNLEAIKSLKFFGKSKKIAPDLISKL